MTEPSDPIYIKKEVTTGWTTGVLFSAAARDLFLLHRDQTASGAHPASYQVGSGELFTGDKTAGA
jgi:hypothetical protein